MLKRISVRDLGCFDDQDYAVDFSEETLLAGPNNSGKSMLLTALNLARYWLLTGKMAWDTEFYSLHDFVAAANAHDQGIGIEVSFMLEELDGTHLFKFQATQQHGVNAKVQFALFHCVSCLLRYS